MILVIYGAVIVIVGKFRSLERQITDLARQVALKNPQEPKSK